jgi:hypothetical protein
MRCPSLLHFGIERVVGFFGGSVILVLLGSQEITKGLAIAVACLSGLGLPPRLAQKLK